MQSSNRWYDKDPTVSLAVSILRSASPDKQKIASQKIIKEAQSMDITMNSSYESIMKRRWYDSYEDLFYAIEYLRSASSATQKKLAVIIINILCELED